MAIVKTVDVFCDIEGCHMWHDTGVTHCARHAGDSSATARKVASRHGWARVKNEAGVWLDLCPNHARQRGAD